MFKCALCFSLLESCGPPNDIISFFCPRRKQFAAPCYRLYGAIMASAAGIYLSCTMAITTLAMVSTVFVLNLYSMRERPVPPWAKRVFIVYMARILCMCNCITPSEDATGAASMSPLYARGRNRRTDRRRGNSTVELFYQSDGACESRLRRDDSPPLGPTSRARHNGNSQNDRIRPPVRRRRLPATVNYAKEWVHVATVCDRLFFWLCLLFTIITTLLLFHPLATSHYFKLPIIA